MTEKKTPKHWQIKKLSEVCDLQNGFAFKSSDYVEKSETLIFRMSQIRPGGGLDLNHNSKYLPDNFVEKHKNYLLNDGDVVIAMTDMATETKILGLPTYFKSDGRKFLLNQRVGKLFDFNTKEIEVKYLRYILSSPDVIQYYKSFGKGALQINLGKSDILNAEIPIPPLETQQAIVSKIEELFSELDKGIEDLKTAQQQLKTYRQSVLKWAFEGKLTNENVKEGQLPEGWESKKLGELGKWKGGGTPSKQNKSFWENGTNLWVSSKDMKFKTINDSIDKITDEAIVKSSAKIISKGAILFVMRSGILRHTLPVAIANKDLTVNQDLQSVEPYDFIDSEYLYWFVVGQNQKIRQECSKDGTTVESIDTTSLKKFPIQIAPLKEQHLIVQEIESRLSVADKMEESIAQSLQQAEALRQSILKKAFSGELV
jgi:type I restriction enzyme S subunit